jgi:hypothetical protein
VLAVAAVATFTIIMGWTPVIWKWLLALPLATQLLAILTLALSVAVAALALKLRAANARPSVTFNIDGHEKIPEFLLPREVHEAQRSASAPLSNALKRSLLLQLQENKTSGIVACLKNNDITPLEGCHLILKSLGKWHSERNAFREPSFSPVRLISPATLQPDKVSTGTWLLQFANYSQISLPTGLKGEYEKHSEDGVWLYKFDVHAGADFYNQNVVIEWQVGQHPTIKTVEFITTP